MNSDALLLSTRLGLRVRLTKCHRSATDTRKWIWLVRVSTQTHVVLELRTDPDDLLNDLQAAQADLVLYTD